MLWLEQDITRKKQVDKHTTRLKFEFDNNEKYKVKCICDSTVYVKELEDHHVLSYNNLVSSKGYPKEKKHLEACVEGETLSKDNYHFLQRSS